MTTSGSSSHSRVILETQVDSATQVILETQDNSCTVETQVVISSESASTVKANENADDSVEDAEEIHQSPAKI